MAPEVRTVENGPHSTLFFRVDLTDGAGFDESAFDRQLLDITREWQTGDPNQGTARYMLIDHTLIVFPYVLGHLETRGAFGGVLRSAGLIRFNLNIEEGEGEESRRILYGHSTTLEHELPPYLSDLNKQGLAQLLAPHFAVE